MEFEKIIQTKLDKKNIPYKRHVKLVGENNAIITEFDFIMPNAVIEAKGGLCSYSQNTFLKQLILHKSIIPEHFQMYYYFENIPKKYILDILDEHNVLPIYCIDDIQFNDDGYEYYTNDSSVIRMIGSLEKTNINNFINQFNILRTSKDIYYKGIVCLDDNCLDTLNKVNWIISNKTPEKYIKLQIKNKYKGNFCQVYDNKNKNDIWNKFTFCIPYNDFKHCSELIFIDGITKECKRCYKIYYKLFNHEICKRCFKNSNKRKFEYYEIKPNKKIKIEIDNH